MSHASPPSKERFADLFVELTGRSTIEEHQEPQGENRVTDADHEVGAYVAETARQTGLDDAIDTSQDY